MTDSKPNMKHVAIVEDDTMLSELVKSFLDQHNLLVTIFNSAESFLAEANVATIDIIICDINMPDMNGFELCKNVRQSYNGPFIFLTARKDEVDQIKGLNLGADDYINKPVKPHLLLARINAALRTGDRIQNPPALKRVEFDNFVIDINSRVVEINNQTLSLTSDELDLLWLLASRKDQTVSRDDMFVEVVGRKYDGLDRTIDGRISRLRKKFNSFENNPYEIKTVWRLGYVFAQRCFSETSIDE